MMAQRILGALTILMVMGLTHQATAWTPRLEADFYMDNVEHFNRYREGQTWLGISSTALIWHSVGPFIIEAGGFARKDFGSAERLDQIAPYLRMSAFSGPWAIIVGTLDNRNRFGLPDAQYMQQNTLMRPMDYGAQLRYFGRHFSQELWISWYLLNTPEHREMFAAGSLSRFTWRDFTIQLTVLESHHGGQLFDTGPVADNVSAELRFQYYKAFGSWWGIGARIGALGDVDVPDRSQSDLTNYGGGIQLGLLGRVLGADIGFSVFGGKNFVVELGNPMYRTEEPFWQLHASRSFEIGPSRLTVGVRTYVIEESFEYAYSLMWQVGLDACFLPGSKKRSRTCS